MAVIYTSRRNNYRHLSGMEEISGRDLVLAISCVFQQMENKSRCFLVQQPVTIFSCQEIPVIPLREYLERCVCADADILESISTLTVVTLQ